MAARRLGRALVLTVTVAAGGAREAPSSCTGWSLLFLQSEFCQTSCLASGWRWGRGKNEKSAFWFSFASPPGLRFFLRGNTWPLQTIIWRVSSSNHERFGSSKTCVQKIQFQWSLHMKCNISITINIFPCFDGCYLLSVMKSVECSSLSYPDCRLSGRLSL